MDITSSPWDIKQPFLTPQRANSKTETDLALDAPGIRYATPARDEVQLPKIAEAAKLAGGPVGRFVNMEV